MDDQDDREYSRAPALEDLLNLCKALNAEGVRYVLNQPRFLILKNLRLTAPRLAGTRTVSSLLCACPG